MSAPDHRPLADRLFGAERTAGSGLDERLALVRSALLRLPPLDRRILMMTMVSGWHTVAIADAFHLPPAAVRRRFSLALQNVQAFIATTGPVEARPVCSAAADELVERYVSGRLSVEERAAFEGHTTVIAADGRG